MMFVNLVSPLAYSGLASGFQTADINLLNSFRKTNVFYKNLLTNKNLPEKLASHAKTLSAQSPKAMPTFTLMNGSQSFFRDRCK
jgi:hypothetical protein